MQAALGRLVEGQDIGRATAARCMKLIMSGEAEPMLVSAFLVALRMKGETPEEIAGCAEVMREHARRISAPAGAIDTCGTGGDGAHTFNVSTGAALVAAGMGIPVAKHGNRSVSSSCGSADVLQALGVKVDCPPERVEECLRQANFGFLFAPLLHASMRHAMPVRRALGMRTVFNVLGPLTNPAGVKRQVLGVFSRALVRPLAEVLRLLGCERALVVSSEDGLDEISLGAPTRAVLLTEGRLEELLIDPAEWGLARIPAAQLACGGVLEAAEVLRGVLEGKPGPARDIVCLNAAAAAFVAGKVRELQEGIALAGEALDRQAARQVLEKVAVITSS